MAAYLARSGLAGRLEVDPSASHRRFGERGETAAYYCFVQALDAAASSARGHLTVQGDTLVLTVDDPAVQTMDTRMMTDRVEAVDGSLTVVGADGEQLIVRLPIETLPSASAATVVDHAG